jgi:sugar/nucleoside kinase (ribokinase family)
MPPKGYAKHKIGAIGTINRDTIYQPDGSRIESWGGLLYSLKYLCEAGMAKIFPVVNIGRDSFRSIHQILQRFDNIDLSHISKVPEKNNHCFLHYADQSHKCETLKGSVSPLTYSRAKPLLNCDLVLVNFISGPDIKLSALEKFRENYSGIIYMDIHSLTLGRKKVLGGYHRYMRRPRHWKRYVSRADILQVNEVEFQLLSGTKFSRKNAVNFMEKDLKHLKCMAITCGAGGSLLVYRRAKILHSRNIPAIKVRKVHDTTGCGDIFGAGFINEYLKSGSFIKAAQNGNRLAAARCRKKGKVF